MDGPWGLRIRSAYAVCLLCGASTHLITLIQHGPLYDYGGVNIVTQVFWNSLIVADPLAAICLILRPRLGLGLAAAIIGLDVLNNLAVYIYGRLNGASHFTVFLGLQIAFLLFVAATIRIPWRETRVRQRANG